MSSIISPRDTIADLAQVDGRAELINGRIIHLRPLGDYPSEIAQEIIFRLRDYTKKHGQGYAKTSKVAYVISSLHSGRESFCPVASYFAGELPPRNMGFIEGPPTFAVEVRSENDYGERAEAAMAAKRADYFAAGTLVVWDVDPRKEVINIYRASDPLTADQRGRNQQADAEPALPGWSMTVNEVFDVT